MNPVLPFVEALSALAQALVPYGLCLLVQSTLVLGLGLLLGALLRRQSALLRAQTYRAALAGVVGVALISLLGAGRLPALWYLAGSDRPQTAVATPQPTPVAYPATPAPPMAGMSEDVMAMTPPAAPSIASEEAPVSEVGCAPQMAIVQEMPPAALPPVPPPAAAEAPSPDLALGATALFGVWLIGTLSLLLWLAFGYAAVARLRRNAKPLTEGIAADHLWELARSRRLTPPALLVSKEIASPCFLGWWHPAILLPATHESDFEPATLRAILAHELEHAVRRDNWWGLLGRLLCAFGWMQPLLWLTCRRSEEANEAVCDLAALESDCTPRAYADCLLQLASRPRPAAVFGIGMASFRSALGRRVQAVLSASRSGKRKRQVSPGLRLAVAGGLLTIVLVSPLIISAYPAEALSVPTAFTDDITVAEQSVVMAEPLSETPPPDMVEPMPPPPSPDAAPDRDIPEPPEAPEPSETADLPAPPDEEAEVCDEEAAQEVANREEQEERAKLEAERETLAKRQRQVERQRLEADLKRQQAVENLNRSRIEALRVQRAKQQKARMLLHQRLFEALQEKERAEMLLHLEKTKPSTPEKRKAVEKELLNARLAMKNYSLLLETQRKKDRVSDVLERKQRQNLLNSLELQKTRQNEVQALQRLQEIQRVQKNDRFYNPTVSRQNVLNDLLRELQSKRQAIERELSELKRQRPEDGDAQADFERRIQEKEVELRVIHSLVESYRSRLGAGAKSTPER